MQAHGHASSSRKTANLSKESMQVPEEIIYNILVRIPAEFLIILKAVCKLWLDIISDRKFVNAHLSHHQLDFHYVVVSKQTPEKTFWKHEYDLISLNNMENTRIQLQEQQLQGLLKDRIIHFESSNGGLLLFVSSTREQLYVCNPVTRKCTVLSTPCSDFKVHHATNWSLLHDDSKQKFMVVGLATKLLNRCFVYIPHSNTTNWKMFEPPQPYYVRTKPILINKELHWLGKSYDQHKSVICSLEVAEEKFSETQVPFLSGVQWCQNYIMELNGSICVTNYCSNNNHFDIWTLQNREKCIWNKGSVIAIPKILAFQWGTPVSIFHYSNKTKLVTSKDNMMVFTYDFKNKEWKNFTYPVKNGIYVWCLSAHINSLVKFE